MRGIKFRAYIKDTNKRAPSEINKIVEVKSLHLGSRKAIIGYTKSPSNYGNYSISFDDIELMQYTGSHDKNGKEIYEGDIVGDKDIKWVIKWNLHRMGFSLYPTTEQLYDEMPINVENKLGFEILGNIYDNPDLLEKGAEE